MKRNYFSLAKSGQTAVINIFGDICSWAWEEFNEMDAPMLSKQLEALGDVDSIDVHINSYGGEVAEGLAIYNTLRNHKAKVTTYCDGFACSIASVIFMAGDERVMNESSLLMIHNAWMYCAGNADELRKQADDLEKINQASVEAYKSHSSISEEEIKVLMDNETWILPGKALEYGFATSIDAPDSKNANQSAFKQLMDIITVYQAEKEPDKKDEPEEPEKDSGESGEEPEKNDDEEPNEGSDNKEATTQKWSGFFNALK